MVSCRRVVDREAQPGLKKKYLEDQRRANGPDYSGEVAETQSHVQNDQQEK
jgi:hypothetical protein